MLKNPFFLNKGPFTLKKIFNESQIIFNAIDKGAIAVIANGRAPLTNKVPINFN